MKRWGIVAVSAFLMLSVLVVPATAGMKVYEKDGKSITIGGRVQIQYTRLDPDVGDATDDLFFRRLRPYIEGRINEDWTAKIQFDFGKSLDSDEVAVKDAYIRYSGFEAENLKLTVGNAKPAFSREFLISSKYQQSVERSFVGDHNFGSPDRALGLRLDGKAAGKKIWYAASFGAERHDPDVRRMDLDTPVNDSADWNQGWLAAARVDFHPLGEVKFSQGDFHTDEFKFTVSAGAFNWANDDDRNTYTDAAGMATSTSKADLDSATGFEISGGVRGHGLSVDLQYNLISGETVDPTFTGGIYVNGETDQDIMAIEAGYMVYKDKVEIMAGWDSLDADGYADKYERTRVGLNWFWKQHNAKVQLNYTDSTSVFGVKGDDLEAIHLQMQYVF